MTFLCHFDALEKLAKEKSIGQKQLAAAIGLSETDFSKAKRGNLTEAQIQSLEALVGPSRSLFSVVADEAFTKEAFDDKDIRRIYEDLTNKNKASTTERYFVAVISGNEFLELEDQAFFNSLCQFISEGMEVKYYYSDSEHEASIRRFETLYRRFEDRFGSQGEEMERIAGFKISREPSLFFGWGARYVMFCRRNLANNNTSVIHGLTYIECSIWDEQQHKQVGDSRLWVRMKDDDAHKYMLRLVNYAEPIKNLCCFFDNRFERRLRDDYRRAFGHADNCKIYRQVVKALGSGDIVGNALRGISHVLLPHREQEFEFLDIGFGDGDVTSAALKQLKLLGMERVRATIVDSAGAPHEHRHGDIQIVPAFDCPFEDWPCNANKFDLIVVSHVLYLIDPSYLDKLYDLLKPQGFAVVIHAPRNDNFINFVTDFLDAPAAERTEAQNAKARKPKRLFAEDLDEHLRARFGSEGVTLTKHPGNGSVLPRQDVLTTNQRLTEFGKKLLELFSCRKLETKELNEVVAAIRSKYGDQGLFTNESWVFTINKKKIREQNAPKIYGALTTIR